MLSVRDADRDTLPHARGPRRPARGDARRHHRLRDPAAAQREHGITRGVVRRRRASVHGSGARPRRRRAARQRARRAAPARRSPGSRSSRTASPPATTSACSRRETPPLRDRVDDILREAMRDGTLERIFRKWDVWNDDQPALYRRVLAGEPIPPVVGARLRGRRRDARSRWAAALRYLPSLLRASASRSCSRACRWRSRWRSACSIASGRVYGNRPPARRAHGVRRADARHAGAAAAVRPLLRPRRRDPAAGLRRRRCSVSRSTTPRTRARSTAARSRRSRTAARGGANARA